MSKNVWYDAKERLDAPERPGHSHEAAVVLGHVLVPEVVGQLLNKKLKMVDVLHF